MARNVSGYRKIVVKPVTGYVGSEIEGIDLSKPLDDETYAELRRAWIEAGVLFFRNQSMTPDTMEALGARFGTLTITSYANSVLGYKFAHTIARSAEAKQGERNFGDSWHMDQTVREIPNAGFALYAKTVPEYGGDTGFSSLYAAYDLLSPGMKKLCESLIAVHSPAGLFGRDGMSGPGKKPFLLRGADTTYAGMTPEKVREYMAQETLHPLVCEHPESGRKHICITGYVTRFDGMDEEESQPIIEYLTRHVVRPEITCRQRWYPGSLAIIDNRCLQHIAYQDYAGHGREMLRIEWEGDVRPFGPAMPRQPAVRAAAE
jgi:taurine dioxygenase